MPPKRSTEDVQTLKERLHSTNGRGRRMGGAHGTNGSSLKEVDNASTNSGQTSNDLDTSNVSHRLTSAHLSRLSMHHHNAHQPLTFVPRSDEMDVARACRSPGLPTRLPPRHALDLQEPTQPRRPRPGHRPHVPDHGTRQVETTGPERPPCNGGAEELQRSWCQRERRHNRLAVQDKTPGQGVSRTIHATTQASLSLLTPRTRTHTRTHAHAHYAHHAHPHTFASQSEILRRYPVVACSPATTRYNEHEHFGRRLGYMRALGWVTPAMTELISHWHSMFGYVNDDHTYNTAQRLADDTVHLRNVIMAIWYLKIRSYGHQPRDADQERFALLCHLSFACTIRHI